jgi:glycosyltransferase involved in cell wall biosynthesis
MSAQRTAAHAPESAALGAVTPATGCSVLVITYNEEDCIAACIESVGWSDDILVVDSFSTDRTTEILARYSAVRVIQRVFDDYSSQRNFGLHKVGLRNDWVLIIDADETCPPALRTEILDVIAAASRDVQAFRLRRRIWFLGSALEHNGLSGVWLDRLVRPMAVHYVGVLHEKPTFVGRSRPLRERLDHYPYGKGITHWMHRRNGYSSLAAAAEIAARPPLRLADALAGNPIRRRYWLNALYRRLPARWLIFLLYNVFVKWCFLDGVKGMHMILLETSYEFLTAAKIRERQEAST